MTTIPPTGYVYTCDTARTAARPQPPRCRDCRGKRSKRWRHCSCTVEGSLACSKVQQGGTVAANSNGNWALGVVAAALGAAPIRARHCRAAAESISCGREPGRNHRYAKDSTCMPQFLPHSRRTHLDTPMPQCGLSRLVNDLIAHSRRHARRYTPSPPQPRSTSHLPPVYSKLWSINYSSTPHLPPPPLEAVANHGWRGFRRARRCGR